ncbi:MAG: MBL fold metallo-hydrolase [Pseudomonadota bacterium]
MTFFDTVLCRLCLLVFAGFGLLVSPASAQGTDSPARKPSHCLAVAQSAPGITYLHKASFRDPVPQGRVRMQYVAHATFLIQTEGGTSAATDFSGFLGSADFLPDVVTMNKAHETHWTAFPDPAIPHVLPGWGPVDGEGIAHYLDLGDMVVRNVSTDLVSPYIGVREARGNSIFVFEAAGLCIGHLGHLHHTPTDEQFAALGRVDVVMAPVDGGFTMPLDQMIDILKRLRSSIVIPMHWFTDGGLRLFLTGMEDQFAVIETGLSSLTVSLETLPAQPTVMVLRPEFLRDAD